MRFHLADVDMTNRWDNGAFRGEGGGILTVRRGRKFTRILESSLSFVLGINYPPLSSFEIEGYGKTAA